MATPAADAQTPPAPAPTLKSILLAQLKSTHTDQDWFAARRLRPSRLLDTRVMAP